MTADPRPDVPEVDAVSALLATSRVMTALVARTMSDMDESVSLPNFRLLVMLRYEGTLNVKTIAGGLGVNSSSVSRACEKLVRAGLVLREDAAHDRRNVSVSLTSEGRALVDSLMAARAELLVGVVATMTEDDRNRLTQALSTFLAAVETSGLSEQLMTRNAATPVLDI